MECDKNLIILDEPTSNLDPIAESEIFQKFIELNKDKTIIFVTHRINISSLADRIVLIKDGQIIGDNSHEELIGSNSEYKKIYMEQAKWYDR